MSGRTSLNHTMCLGANTNKAARDIACLLPVAAGRLSIAFFPNHLPANQRLL